MSNKIVYDIDVSDEVNMKLGKMRKINTITSKVGSVLMGISSLPQIISIWKAKDSMGVSPMFIGMVALSLATFIFNGYVVYLETGDKRTMRIQYPNFIGMVVLLISIFIFK